MNLSAADDLENLYLLANQSMDVVTQLPTSPKNGTFDLSPVESDLTMGIGQNDHLIGEYISLNSDSTVEPDCPKEGLSINEVKKSFNDRFYRIGGLVINGMTDFERVEKKKFSDGAYDSVMMKYYGFPSLLKHFSPQEFKLTPEENAAKLAGLIKKDMGKDVPVGILTVQFLHRDIVAKPGDWKSKLEKSKDSLSFEDKVRLVAKFGGDFSNDYDFARADNSGEGGFVTTETLIKNLSNNQKGGICRDVSLAQTQMLSALGVKNSYTVAFNTMDSGHATVIAVDPNDKNRIIKINYNEINVDDGKKGSKVLDQDTYNPSVGIRYRVYDSEGKPLASIPTELGKILKESTGQGKDYSSSSSYDLNRVFVGTNEVEGSLFSGKTSTGEAINGVALYGRLNPLTSLTLEGGLAAFKSTSDRTYYRNVEQDGLYGYGKGTASAKVYEGSYGTIKGEVSGTVEVMKLRTEEERAYGMFRDKESGSTTSIDYGNSAKISYEKAADKDVAGASVEIKGRWDKNNVADEKTYGLHYDSTVVAGNYRHNFTENIKAGVDAAIVLSRYGESASLKASLEDEKNKVTVGVNKSLSRDTPTFFPGQEDLLRAAYERRSAQGWRFLLEYEKSLTSGVNSLKAQGGRDF